MPRAHVINEVAVQRSPRVMQVESIFDVPPAKKSRREWDVDLPLEEREWNVGLIVGPSGAGKSSVARELFGKKVITGFRWPPDKSILDAFPEASIKEVTGLLSAVGFSSPPSWLRPFAGLSTGEQFRVTVARALAESAGLVVIDEFTSTVDRQVAKVTSHTVQKAVRKRKRQLVAVTCHYDVVDWLQPDWVYQPHDASFSWRSLQRRPGVDLVIRPVGRDAWPAFSHHHYLSADLKASAKCFGGFIDDNCVAFNAVLFFPHPKVANIYMGHRLVVLPDFQGLGIGPTFDDWLGLYLYDRGYRYHKTISHPALVQTFAKSPRWRMVKRPGMNPMSNSASVEESLRGRRMNPRAIGTVGFEYVPPAGTPRPARRARHDEIAA